MFIKIETIFDYLRDAYGSLKLRSLTLVVDFLVNMSASADVLAMAKVEVDLAAIPLGKNVSKPNLKGGLSLFFSTSRMSTSD